MPIVILQHSELGGPGRLGATLRDHGFRLDFRRPDVHPVGSSLGLPGDLDGVQGLVILGGPQNVTDIAKFPWMEAEAGLIRAAHARELPVIGICLGAQLIAHALGGRVAAREKPVIGFDQMSLNPAGQTETMLSGLAWDHPQLFSCGQEIAQLPPGAVLLASTRGNRNVVFKAGVRTYGFVCHFECDRPMADALMAASQGDMPRAGVTPGEVKVQADQWYAMYARQSDRLCVNVATYGFPLQRRLRA